MTSKLGRPSPYIGQLWRRLALTALVQLELIAFGVHFCIHHNRPELFSKLGSLIIISGIIVAGVLRLKSDGYLQDLDKTRIALSIINVDANILYQKDIADPTCFPPEQSEMIWNLKRRFTAFEKQYIPDHHSLSHLAGWTLMVELIIIAYGTLQNGFGADFILWINS